MNGFIRIIGGKWRGRKLPVLDNDGLRPTTDRIKETLFNWLMPVIQDANCLDCFSGSGSLGFEAISRGASQVTLIEKNRSAFKQLQKNVPLLQANQVKITNADTLNWLDKPAIEQYDIVFIDPPFNKNLIGSTLQSLEQNGWLNINAYIYVETEHNNMLTNDIPINWKLHREKKAGQVYSRLFIREQ